jgi:hypothetical protein
VNSEHIQADAVKDYLLGTLPDDQASAIEERSFTDPAFFNEIRRVEIDLICEFLDDKLTKEDHEQFRHRYLRIPRLKRLVDEVHEQREKNIPRSHSMALRISVAAALVCIAVVGFVVLRKELAPPVHKASVETRLPSVTLFLEPGVTMGAGSEARKLVLPLKAQPIALIAELPGQTASAEYVARVFSIGRDGSRQNVFTSGNIRSVSRSGGQQVTVALSSTDLSPGDYIMELQRIGGEVSETYIFRIAAAKE